ncbi:P-loop containing nucleoside triphosphate hydrolase protein [Protomyces lactucae-debilis]|uniref:p-loop containing nucleoside triphosphate hydrolase protein n=1 Tax=Protomyces lactucae-debilis TaxID=2754530 RepID=A0A1Y2F815_PROLT|nr:P-loop containing nucleoside triphosphate hydrolase protein [Protomyces lactucae-debilis]ORY79506.1 P-loop containing nucleoside triphosphate hydrolase protein [Protomyces lactucae-debilis]
MPGRRVRGNDSGDEEFEIHVDETPPTKRVRRNKYVGEEAADNQEDGDDVESAPEETENEDDDDEDIDAEEEVILPTTQSSQHSKIAEAGTIESIELFDFMCHAHFKIELGPNLNFVVGMNGSGKSAVLTAITVCLGGKAAASGRGTSVKSLVRDGASQATIIIVMRNKGEDAFLPKQYGDRIIVERKFKLDGSGSYALKSSGGTRYGSRKEDLDQLCDHFGLQIDNPMNILSQDFAREFLAQSTPTTLYALFMKGIDMSQLEADHNLLNEQIATTTTILETREAGVAALKEQVDAAEKMFATTESARKTNEELDAIKDEMAWAQVVEAEEARDAYNSEIAEYEEKLRRAEEKVGKGEIKLEEIRSQMIALRARCSEIEGVELQPIRDRKAAILKEVNAGKEELLRLASDNRDLMDQIKRAKRDVIQCQKAVDDEREAQATNAAGRRVQHLEEQKRTIETNLASVRALGDSIAAEAEEIARNRERKEHALADASRRAASLKEDTFKMQAHINQQKEAQKDGVRAYPDGMQKLLDGIERNKWVHKPIGPFGMTMKLKYREWADIVENYFGRNLNSFYVKTYKDKMQLQNLMRSVNCSSTIVFSTDDSPFRVDEPDPKYLTILRAIEWSNESVKRRLLISHSVGNQLLIKDRREADDLMNGRSKPAHAHCAYAISADNPRKGFRIGGGAAGSSSSSPVDQWNGQFRLTTLSSAMIEQEKQRLKRMEAEFMEAEDVSRTLRRELNDLTKQLADCESQRKGNVRKISRAEAELRKIAEQLDEVDVLDDGKLSGLLENLAVSEQAQITLDNSYQALSEERAELDRAQLERKLLLTAADKELKELEGKLAGLTPQLDELADQMSQLEAHTDHYRNQVPKYRKSLEDSQARQKEQDIEVRNITRMASQMCARVEVTKSRAQLNQLLNTKTRVLQRLQKDFDGQSVAEIASELDRAKTAYKNATSDIKELQELVDMLTECLDQRITERERFRKQICLRVRYNFQQHLSNRSYKGRIRFDHKAQQLIMKVSPTKESAEAAALLAKGSELSASKGKRGRNAAGGNNKGLSGGEKSFTTICLLLSMWDAMNCPIRALDEFDVFMDAVNRTVALSMITKSTNESADKQFILITPQDMQGVKEDKYTKIMMLHDPRTMRNRLTASA